MGLLDNFQKDYSKDKYKKARPVRYLIFGVLIIALIVVIIRAYKMIFLN